MYDVAEITASLLFDFHFYLESEGTGKGRKEKFPYSMTLHRNVRSFGANKQGQGWEKQVFLTQPI